MYTHGNDKPRNLPQLQLQLRSAEDLQDVRRCKFGKLPLVYAIAWVASSPIPPPPLESLCKTSLPPISHLLPSVVAQDEESLYPTWRRRAPIVVPLSDFIPIASSRTSYLFVRLFAQRSRHAFPNPKHHNIVGTVVVPLSDILHSGLSAGSRWQLLSYNVRTPSGFIKGVLNFSARLIPPGMDS